MKKAIKSIIMGTLLIIVLTACISVSAYRAVTVKLNGETLDFDVQPRIIDGRTMVPMRELLPPAKSNKE